MIKDNYKKLLDLINARTFRERVAVTTLLFFITFILWMIVFGAPLWNKEKQLAHEIQAAQTQIQTYKDENNAILTAASSHPVAKMLAKQSGLHIESETLKQRLSDLIPKLLTSDEMQKVINSLLTQADNIEIINLQQTPGEEWTPPGLKDIPMSANSGTIYKHGIQLECKGTYFNIMSYLNRLEKLPWSIYWDNLHYSVTAYPEANVVLNFYLLTNQKG